MKKIILIFAVMALLAGGWLFWRLAPSDESPDTLKLYGNVDIRQVSLAFEQGGRVTELFAEEGDRVTRGQLLARVDVTGLKLEADKLRADIAAQEQNLLKMKNGNRPEEIARAEAALRTAEASLEQAKRNDARMANLRRGNSVSAQERENAQTSLRVAQGQRDEAAHALALLREGYRDEDIAMAAAQLSSARAALAIMQHNIELGELFSPTDAVVSSRLLEPGDMASSATPVFLLSLTSPKWVRAYVTHSSGHEGRHPHRLLPRSRARPGGLHFAHSGIHAEKRADRRPAHLAAVRSAHRGRRCRRPSAPRHARERCRS